MTRLRRVHKPTDINEAVEVFARGFAFTRSFTHPYLAERAGPLWVVRDAPRKRGNYRNEEWIGSDVAPKEIDRIARKHTRGRFAICALHGIDESDESLRSEFKELDYRLGDNRTSHGPQSAPDSPLRPACEDCASQNRRHSQST